MSPSSPAGSSSSSLPYSNALLALPDGAIPASHPDSRSHTVSLIGGYPTFPSLPSTSRPPTAINCGACHNPIPLLSQVYCPPENGQNDRTIYVFGCPKTRCQRREGSLRAFRASVRNEEYVKDVEAKRIEEEKRMREEREKARVNPFSMGGSDQPNGSALFGSAQPLFGAQPPPVAATATATATNEPPDLSKLFIASSSTTLAPPLPAYQPAQYITTIDEYLPPPEDIDMDSDDDEETPEQKAEWKDERWEQLLPKHMDEVFEKFVRRLENAEDGSKQVLRYDLGGIPLPYSSTSLLFRKLFPTAPLQIVKNPASPDADEEDIASYYDPSVIPPCPRCNAKRVFELQLVPNLISVLSPDSLSTTGEAAAAAAAKNTVAKLSEDERKRELARLAAGAKDEGGVGEMEWGTVMVFGCERDCEGWEEEWVGVEWEQTLTAE